MNSDVLVVWKDKEGQLVNTYRDEGGKVRVLDLNSLDEQQGTFVHDEQELLAELDKLSGQRLYVPVSLARAVLGWDV